MSLKTVRVCDECKRETPERDDYIVVRLYRNSVGLPTTLEEVSAEVHSYGCVESFVARWCHDGAKAHPELDE